MQVLTGDAGGYTYDDVGDGQLGTQVHAAGEAWAQTLFDIRERLGHKVTMAIVTEGMRLSADDPSMLDMRDAIIAADEAIYGGAHYSALWNKFADRGFGFYAGSDDGNDAAPVADFNTPPPPGTPTGRIAGTVTDSDGNPLPGAVVRIAGHSEFSDTTDANGEYKITGVPEGTWPKVVASVAGYEPDSDAVTVTGGTPGGLRRLAPARLGVGQRWRQHRQLHRAGLHQLGCGPGGAIDLSQGTGWGSTTTATTAPRATEPGRSTRRRS